MNFAERRVTMAVRSVRLTDIEYEGLAELAADAGRVVTYEHLLRRVCGLDADVRPIRTAASWATTPEPPPTFSPSSASATGYPRGRQRAKEGRN